MLKDKIIIVVIILSFHAFSSCSQEKIGQEQPEPIAVKHKVPHSYGGWYCPDNFGGFPPVDVRDLNNVTVVNDRLPTQEEARNGTSLLYFDQEEYPSAKPLNMKFPRLARTYSKHNDINELIIVIQAVTIGQDTVVGFRYPSGGNGSAWFDEVSFLSDQELEEIGSTPYVYLNTKVNASKEDIWKAFTTTSYANKLGDRFNKKEFFNSEWNKDSKAHLNFESNGSKAAGIVMNMWGNLYMQIDYDNNGFHFAEKLLIAENRETNTSELHIVSGPYPVDFAAQNTIWGKWIEEIKELSELK